MNNMQKTDAERFIRCVAWIITVTVLLLVAPLLAVVLGALYVGLCDFARRQHEHAMRQRYRCQSARVHYSWRVK